MTTRNRLQAESALAGYTRRHKRHTVSAALGNNAGTVEHPTRDGWVYARLHGDGNQVVLAYCAASVPLTAGLVVTLERVERKAAAFYQVLGISENIIYPDNTFAGGVGAHAPQHQRRDRGAGGFDPLDVYTRALVNLRGRAQAAPNLTLYVERGFYNIDGVELFAGGNSPAFTPPAPFGAERYDLLYIGSDDVLHIEQGANDFTGNPAYPVCPASAVPIAYVLLANGQATIEEQHIDDARCIASAGGTHRLLSTVHSDTQAASIDADIPPVNGDVIYGHTIQGWNRLAVGAENKFLTVTDDGGGGLFPQWALGFDDLVTVAGEVVVFDGNVTWTL